MRPGSSAARGRRVPLAREDALQDALRVVDLGDALTGQRAFPEQVARELRAQAAQFALSSESSQVTAWR